MNYGVDIYLVSMTKISQNITSCKFLFGDEEREFAIAVEDLYDKDCPDLGMARLEDFEAAVNNDQSIVGNLILLWRGRDKRPLPVFLGKLKTKEEIHAMYVAYYSSLPGGPNSNPTP